MRSDPLRIAASALGRSSSYGLAAATLALLLATAGVAEAQVSIAPSIVELTPHDTAHAVFVTVTNQGEHDLDARFYAADFDEDSTGDLMLLSAGEHQRSCAGRVRIFPGGAALKPGHSQELRIHMEPGSETCWSLIYAEAAAPLDGDIQVVHRSAVRAYGLQPGARRDGEVTAIRVTEEPDSFRLDIVMQNTGDGPIRPAGRVEIRTPDGQVLRAAPIAPFTVLPEHHRLLHVVVLARLEPGEYLIVPTLDFGGDYLIAAHAPLNIR